MPTPISTQQDRVPLPKLPLQTHRPGVRSLRVPERVDEQDGGLQCPVLERGFNGVRRVNNRSRPIHAPGLETPELALAAGVRRDDTGHAHLDLVVRPGEGSAVPVLTDDGCVGIIRGGWRGGVGYGEEASVVFEDGGLEELRCSCPAREPIPVGGAWQAEEHL